MSNPSVPDAVRQVCYQALDDFFDAYKIEYKPDRKALASTWEHLREQMFRTIMALLCTIPPLGATLWIADLKLIDIGQAPLFVAIITVELMAVVGITAWHSFVLYKCLTFATRLNDRKTQ